MLVLANIFQPLIDVFDAVINFFHDSVGLSWGMAIIALTIVVRTALVPLTLKQFKSMQAMQRLAPEIKALQAKYKDDKQRQQQEMMAFYKENQVNPFGSCLPLVLQLPVFLSLFYMLRKDLRYDICPDINMPHGVPLASPKPCGSTDASQFLFIPDITDKATGAVLVVLIVLYIGSQLASSVLMSVSADRNQRMLMIGLPFVFVTFIVRLPAGLIVYWITTNVWTVAQQYTVRRTLGLMRPATAPAGAAAAVSGSDGKGGKPPPGRKKEPEKSEAVGEPRRGAAPPPPPPRTKKRRWGRGR